MYILLCVILFWPSKIENYLILMQNVFVVWEFKEKLIENLNFGRSGFNTSVFEKHFISYSCILFVRLNLINHFVGFILCQFAYNSAFRNPAFRWESCKGNVWESVKKCSRLCDEAAIREWLTAYKPPEDAHEWSMQRSWTVMPTVALQDKKYKLAIQLACSLDLRLS